MSWACATACPLLACCFSLLLLVHISQEKRSIYDQISAADELKKQQTDLTQRLKAELQFYSVEDIERKIKARPAPAQAGRNAAPGAKA